MEIGVGLPNMVPHLGRDTVLAWAACAEELGFSSLSSGERLGFDKNDTLVELSLAAAATERIRIMTSVLVLPLHPTALVAKQASTLDFLTGGRFVLAVGSGTHPADFDAAPVPFARRFGYFERQITELVGLWRGEPMGESGVPIGPLPPAGRPTLLVGASTPVSARRVRLADGVLTFTPGDDPETQRAIYDAAAASWTEHGRAGRPRFVAGCFFALGPGGAETAAGVLGEYFASYGAEAVAAMADSITTLHDDGLRTAIGRFEEAGVDELVLCPLVPEVDQLRRLADL
jgi:alkanesulfonate monooxygenase SsuD/methylene tetrahydromethanopterin reductase-like flavin-dependent oxidoreductase (luciferase family)